MVPNGVVISTWMGPEFITMWFSTVIDFSLAHPHPIIAITPHNKVIPIQFFMSPLFSFGEIKTQLAIHPHKSAAMRNVLQ